MVGKIYSLIPKVMAEVKVIGKNQKNEDEDYTFRSIDDMYNAIQPALVKLGVFCAPQVQKNETSEITIEDGGVAFRVVLTINHRFYADDGSCVEVITVGEGISASDKACNKAMSAAMKYAFIELLSIPTQDIEDSDRQTPKVIKPKHPIIKVTKVGNFA